MHISLSQFIRTHRLLATGAVFWINAFLFGLWVTRLPEVKDNLELTESTLGLALFFIPLGALAAMRFISQLVNRLGAGRVTLNSVLLYGPVMILPFLATTGWQLGIALFVVGTVMGTMDIAMNAVAAAIEEEKGEVIMPSCHGFWSLGAMCGAGFGSLMLAFGMNALLQAALATLILFCLYFFFLKNHLRKSPAEDQHEEGWVWPDKALLGLTFIGFCAFQGEGAVADWSAIFLRDVASALDYQIGLGYAGFSLSMTLGRLNGNGIVARWGAKGVMPIAFAISLLGLLLVLPGKPWLAIAGYTISGIGFSLIIPIVFSEAARAPGVSPSQGIAAVAGIGYLGFLVGPVIMGGIAELINLRAGFIFVVFMLFFALLVSRR